MTGAARGLRAVMVLVVAAFCVTTIPGVRAEPGFHPLLDGWLQVGGYVLAAAYACTHPLINHQERWLWGLVAAALCLRAVGFAVFVTVVRPEVPPPYPSAADAAWLLSSVVLLVALALRLRARMPQMSTLVVFDAVIGALTTAGVASAVLYAPLVELSASADPAAIATNLAYPVLDVAVLILIAGLLAATRYRPPLSRGVLGVGLATFAIVDCVYLYQISAGTYRPGTWLSALSLVGTAITATAGSIIDTRERERARRAPGLWLTAVCAVVLVGILASASLPGSRVPVVAVALAVAGLFLAIVRAVFGSTLERRVADRQLTAAAIETWRFATLVESSSDLVAMSTYGGRITYLNPAGRQLLGLGAARESADHALTWEDVTSRAELVWRDVARELRTRVEVGLHLELQPLGEEASPVPVSASFFTMHHPTSGADLGIATVMRDVTDRVQAEGALRDLSEQRRDLLSRLVVAEEEERGRIASDVHDDPLQVLAALDLRLGALSGQLEVHQPELLTGLDASVVELRAAMQRLRHLLFDLDSPVAHLGLEQAVRTAADHIFDSTETQVEVVSHGIEQLSEELGITTYRIVREALLNVRRHACASSVVVELSATAEELRAVVRDDGRGLPTELEAAPGHHGLSGMRDRASAAGGTLRLAPGPAGGAELRVVLPI